MASITLSLYKVMFGLKIGIFTFDHSYGSYGQSQGHTHLCYEYLVNGTEKKTLQLPQIYLQTFSNERSSWRSMTFDLISSGCPSIFAWTRTARRGVALCFFVASYICLTLIILPVTLLSTSTNRLTGSASAFKSRHNITTRVAH